MKEDRKVKEEEMHKYKKNIKFTRIREIQVSLIMFFLSFF